MPTPTPRRSTHTAKPRAAGGEGGRGGLRITSEVKGGNVHFRAERDGLAVQATMELGAALGKRPAALAVADVLSPRETRLMRRLVAALWEAMHALDHPARSNRATRPVAKARRAGGR